MLFGQIIAQKRKKASKKYLNVKNYVKIHGGWNGDKSIRNVVRKRDIQVLIKRKNMHKKCACHIQNYSASGALTTDSNLPLCEASQ